MTARQDAFAAGKVTYSTGRPCKRGHVGPRYTKNGACLLCMGGSPAYPSATARLIFDVPYTKADEVRALVAFLLGEALTFPRGTQYLGRPIAPDCMDPYYTAEGVPIGTRGDGKTGPVNAVRTSVGWSYT